MGRRRKNPANGSSAAIPGTNPADYLEMDAKGKAQLNVPKVRQAIDSAANAQPLQIAPSHLGLKLAAVVLIQRGALPAKEVGPIVAQIDADLTGPIPANAQALLLNARAALLASVEAQDEHHTTQSNQ